MSGVQHTPGPWVVEEGPHWLTVCREDAPFTDGKRDPVVGTRWSGAVTDAERANARLIAAAPELLDAAFAFDLLMRQREYELGALSDEMAAVVAKTRAAIAKATGGAA